MFCSGNELGQLGNIEDTVIKRYRELLKEGNFNPGNEVFKVRARTSEVECDKGAEDDEILSGRRWECHSLSFFCIGAVLWHAGVGIDVKALKVDRGGQRSGKCLC
jgi:hypothetical protein